ncbi:MAG: cytochrome c [Anaerolineae bacterium]|nr:c-type cytochrome [Anaerolineales bacterium]MCQ3978754.1 cytochrome C [Anaerolineae bacterium]
MGRVFKWIGFILGGLVGLVALSLVVVYSITEAQLNKTYEVTVSPIAIPTDAAAIERGKHLATTVGFCTDCHGANLAGQVFDEGLLVGRLSVPNLTTGQGGVGDTLTDTDWVRAIRHGLRADGRTLIDMPSNYYYYLSDTDLAAIIAYLKTLPPVDNELPSNMMGPLVRVFMLQDPSLLPGQVIDHTGPRPAAPRVAVTPEYGQYLANACRVCHGDNLAGEPGAGAGQNLTPAGNLAHWTEADFIQTLRTGVTPEDRKLDPELMPWDQVGRLSDDELKAIWLYLKSLPAVSSE